MPDSRESISEAPDQKSSSRLVGPPMARAETRTGDAVADLQTELLAAAISLRGIDESLAGLAEELPTPGDRFDALAELRGAIDCVRSDLLSDAMTTLERAAILSEGELYRHYCERRRVLIL